MKRTGIGTWMVALALLASACGDSDTDGSKDGDKDRGSTGDGDLSAADAKAYDECFDATCEVLIEKGTEIKLDPALAWEATPGLGASSWELLTVTDLSDTKARLTLSAAGESSTGGMATILPVGDDKAYYLKGMTAKVLDSSDGQAVLSLNWSQG